MRLNEFDHVEEEVWDFLASWYDKHKYRISLQGICRKYGVAPPTIGAILNRRSPVFTFRALRATLLVLSECWLKIEGWVLCSLDHDDTNRRKQLFLRNEVTGELFEVTNPIVANGMILSIIKRGENATQKV